MDREEECRHGLNPEWCAPCRGLTLPEDVLSDRWQGVDTESVDRLLERWDSK